MIDLDALAKDLQDAVSLGHVNRGIYCVTVSSATAHSSIDVFEDGSIDCFIRSLNEFWWPVLRVLDRHAHPETTP